MHITKTPLALAQACVLGRAIRRISVRWRACSSLPTNATRKGTRRAGPRPAAAGEGAELARGLATVSCRQFADTARMAAQLASLGELTYAQERAAMAAAQ